MAGLNNTYCHICDKNFSKPANLKKHTTTLDHQQRAGQPTSSYQCDLCDVVFKTSQSLSRHNQSKAHIENELRHQQPRSNRIGLESVDYPADFKAFNKALDEKYNQSKHLGILDQKTSLSKRSSFKEAIMVYTFKLDRNEINEEIKVHQYIINDLNDIIKNFFLKENEHPISFYLTMVAEYDNPSKEATNQTRNYFINPIRIQSLDQLDLDSSIQELEEQMTEESLEGSGLVLKRILQIELKIHPYRNKLGGSYVELPIKTSAILNIDNTGDDFCFVWSILAYLHPTHDHPNRVNNYKPYINELNLTGINFPISYEGVEQYNKQNPQIQVNVFELKLEANNKNYQIPIPIIYDKNNRKGCFLLVYKGHFVLAKNINSLYRTSYTNKCFPCYNCSCSFSSEEVLIKHEDICVYNKPTRAVFPTEEYHTFDKWHYKNPVPFAIYADFEAYNKTVVDPTHPNRMCEQLPFAYGMYIHSHYPNLLNSQYVPHYGEDAVSHFVRKLLDIQEWGSKIFKLNIPLEMTEAQEQEFINTEKCHYCGKGDFTEVTIETEGLPEASKVRDHDHLNGKYRGAAHSKCNLKARKNNFIPVYFHNGSKYDIHLIFEKLVEGFIAKGIIPSILPKSDEQYIVIQVGCLKIMDTYRFMGSALSKLGASLKSDDCQILKSRDCLRGPLALKGIYPYDYIKTDTDFSEINRIMSETSLPPHAAFHSKLYNTNILYTDYEAAKSNWNTFNCTNMYDYTMKYLEIDVLLLADVFENFRKLCLEYYHIDPCYAVSAPGLTWLAGMRYSGVKLKYYKQETKDMLDFLNRGIRGGVSSILGNRIVECNNKLLNPLLNQPIFKMGNIPFVKQRTENHLLYYDAVGLYSVAMCKPLPTGEMEWCTALTYTPSTSDSLGYIYEVDLHYPDNIKEKSKYYPLCPEKVKPECEIFSSWQLTHTPSKYKPTEKLLMTQSDKYNYIIDGQMLDFCLEQGMQLVKIHKKLVYQKSTWLKDYIEFNHNEKLKVQKLKEWFKGDFFKLLNNAFYGKTLESVDKRCNIKFVFDREIFLKKVAKITYKKSTEFAENCVALHMSNSTTKYDKYNYIGFVVLELSKLVMYDFVYNYTMKHFGESAKLHYTDTDSVFLEITTKYNEDVKDKFNLLKDKLIFTEEEKGKLGKFQDEVYGCSIKRFVVNKAKSYNYEKVKLPDKSCGKNPTFPTFKIYKPDELTETEMSNLAELLSRDNLFSQSELSNLSSGCGHVCNKDCKHACKPDNCGDECRQDTPSTKVCNHECGHVTENKKLKGVPKCSYEHVHHDDYRDVVTCAREDIYVDTMRLQSEKHHIYMQKQRKLALNTFDDKRYICGDSITTYPFGYTKRCEHCNVLLNLGHDEHLNIETHNCIQRNVDLWMETKPRHVVSVS